MAKWKAHCARWLAVLMVLNLLLVPGVSANTGSFSHTIDMTKNDNDFNAEKTAGNTANETFSTSTANNFAYVTWDATNIYLGYASPDISHVNNSNASDKWVIAYFGVPGATGTTTTGINYKGQQPGLPFEAKYHLRFKTGNNNYTSLEIYNGTTWTFSKEYKWTTDMQRNTTSSPTFWKIKIPRADLGLTSAKSFQFAMSMLFEVNNGGSMWGALPSDSFANADSTKNGDGFDRDFASFYEFDLQSVNTAAAGQVYAYNFKATSATFETASFSFAEQTGATSVAIQQSIDNGVTWTPSTTSSALDATSKTATVTGLNESTKYKFRLVVTGGSTAGSSTIANVTTVAAPPDTVAPSVPAGVTANSVTATSAVITWTPSTDNRAVKEYEVYNGNTLLGTVSSASYTMSGLTEFSSYSVTVKAKDAAGNTSAASTALSFKTKDVTAPSVPSNVTSADLTATGFEIAWTASTDNDAVAGYEVSLNDTVVATVTNTSYVFTGLTPATSYSVSVKAKDAAGNISAATSALTVSTPAQEETEAPTAPTNLGSSDKTTTGFKVTWTSSTDNVGVTAYEVYNDGVLVTKTPETSYVFSGLKDSTAYKITVKARDAAGNVSVASSELSVSTNDGTVPTVPVGVASSAVTATGFGISWTASTDNVGVTGYEIYKNGTLVDTVFATTYSFTGLTDATKYTITIKAKDADGNVSGASTALDVTTLDATPPASPTQLVSSDISSNGFKVSWKAATDNVAVSGYEILQNGTKVAESKSLAYTFSGLAKGTAYDVTVVAVDAAGNKSAPSTALSVATENKNEVIIFYKKGLENPYIHYQPEGGSWTTAPGIKIPHSGVAGYHKIKIDLGAASKMTAVFNNNGADWDNNAGKNYSFNTGTYTFVPAVGGGTITAGEPDLSAFNWVTIYYKKGFSTPFIHFQPEKGTWTTSPGEQLVESEFKNHNKIVIPVSKEATKLTAAFNNGGTTWDSNSEKNYSFDWGTKTNPVFTYVAGQNNQAGTMTAEAPDSVPPSVPSGFVSSAVQKNAFTVTWTAATDNSGKIAGYDVYLDGAKVATSTIPTYSFTGLSDSTAYNVQVAAVDENGNTSALSAPFETVTADIKAPTTPTALKASDIKVDGFTVTWTASTDNIKVAEYEVYRDSTLVDKTATASYTLTSLAQNITYQITVVAVDLAGNKSPASVALSVKTSETTPPTVPSELSSSQIKTTSFVLSWTKSTDNAAVKEYELYLNDVKVATVVAESYAYIGLNPDTTYSVAVKAIDVNGNVSALSDALNVKTIASVETIPPSVPTAVQASNVTTTSLNVTWTASTDNVGVTGYEVYVDGKLVGSSATTVFNVTGLKQNTVYAITVIAIDDAGNRSVASTPINVTTADGEAPTAPTGMKSSAITNNSFKVEWTAATDNVAVKEYEVYRSGQLLTKTTATEYEFVGLVSNVTFAITVIAVDAAGNKSVASEPLAVKTLGNKTYANTISFADNKNTFFLDDHPDKSKNETFRHPGDKTVGHITWDDNFIYLGYQSDDLAHVSSATESKWLIAYFGVPGVKGTFNGVEYTGQQPKLPFEAKYHFRFQAGNQNYSSLEVYDGSEWKRSKVLNWNTNIIRDALAKPVFVKVRIARADLGLTEGTTLQAVMGMVYEAPTNGSMWGSVPSDAIPTAGFDKDFETFYEFDLTSEKSAPAAQVFNYGLKVTNAAATTATFAFNASTGATSIQLHYSSDLGKTWIIGTLSQPLNANSTVATVTGLTPETNYRFRMVVVGGVNEGSSAVVALKTNVAPDEQPPSAPSELAANEITQTSIKLSWTEPSDNVGVAKYEIFNGGVKVGESTTNSFAVSGLTENTEYSFTIVAFDAAGNKSANSEILKVKTLAAPATVLIFYKKGFSSPYISYKIGDAPRIESPGLALTTSDLYNGYSTITVLLGESVSLNAMFNNGTGDVTKWDSNSNNGYTFTKGTYTFVPNENGGAGTIITGIPDIEAPISPVDLEVETRTENSLKLKWKAATDNVAVTSYVVYRDNVKIATVNEPSFTDTSLVKDTYYSYKIIARDAMYNASPPSKELRVSMNDSLFEKIDRTTQLTSTTAIFDSAKLIEKMDKESITVALTEEKPVVRQIRFEIPALALQTIAAKNPDRVLTLQTSFGTMQLPVSALQLSSIAGRVGTLVKNLKIVVIIKRTDLTVNNELKSMLATQGSTMVIDSVEYRLFGESTDINKKPFEIMDFPMVKKLSTDPQQYHYLTREIELPRDVVLSRATVLAYNPLSKKTQFVPAVFEKRADLQVVVIKAPINMVFAVVETRRTFRDVIRDKADIEMLANKGIVRGTTDTTFSPTVTVKRGQFAALLVRALGLEEDAKAANFKDVAVNHPFAGVIGTASKTGLVKGSTDGRFNPNAEITNSEMAIMLERAATYAGKPISVTPVRISQLLAGFADRNLIQSWATTSVAKAMEAGIVKPAVRFNPTAKVTRAEATIMLKRMLEYIDFINKP